MSFFQLFQWMLAISYFSALPLICRAGDQNNSASKSVLDGIFGRQMQTCDLDRTEPPGDLTLCDNSTLFSIWRPKARFIAPEGWMNDPQGNFKLI